MIQDTKDIKDRHTCWRCKRIQYTMNCLHCVDDMKKMPTGRRACAPLERKFVWMWGTGVYEFYDERGIPLNSPINDLIDGEDTLDTRWKVHVDRLLSSVVKYDKESKNTTYDMCCMLKEYCVPPVPTKAMCKLARDSHSDKLRSWGKNFLDTDKFEQLMMERINAAGLKISDYARPRTEKDDEDGLLLKGYIWFFSLRSDVKKIVVGENDMMCYVRYVKCGKS